jgi:hypothetical protein
MRGNEMSVMFFGGPDGIMAQQHLNSSNVRPVREEFNGERVPKAVWVGMDPRELTNGVNRPAQAPDDTRKLALPGPEKVNRVAARGRERFERAAGVGVKRELDGRRSLLCLPDEQMPALFDLPTAQAGDIADPQAGVEQRQQQGASAFLVGAQPIAGQQHLAYLLPAEWQGGDPIDARRLDGLCRVLREPVVADAERAEGAEVFDFLPLSPRRHFAGGAEGSDERNIQAGDSTAAGSFGERFENVRVGAEGGRGEVTGGAVIQVRFHGRRDAEWGSGRQRYLGGVGARQHGGNSTVRRGCVGRAKGPLVNLAVDPAVTVDRAAAQAVVPALAGVRAVSQMAAVRLQIILHTADFDTDFDTAKRENGKLSVLNGLGVGRLVGFEPEPPQNPPQVEPTTYRTDRLNGRYRSDFDACQNPAFPYQPKTPQENRG